MSTRVYLGEKYSEKNFILFCSKLLKNIQEKGNKIAVLSQYQNYIKECKFIADFKDVNNKSIAIMSVKITDDSNARTTQRNFVAHILSNGELLGYDGALVAYYDDCRNNWKLALVTIDYDLTDRGIKVSFQPAKRFSFLVGVGEPNKTYNEQLNPIYEASVPPTFEKLKEAFSISKVTKDFYSDYCDCFNKLVNYLVDCLEFKLEASRLQYEDVKEFAITFTKKTLGQIVFLHFIQKKGWLGVPLNGEWGDGDKNYIFNSTKNYQGSSYFNEILEPLFYNALNRQRDNDEYENVKIPFLNGGLFSPVENYDWKKTNFNIPNSIWFNKEQNGFLDILSQYNFTVDESDPTEQDIAVDPEMLGKIFESLLDPEERHNKGAHYTPREIVHFMCIESIAYNISVNCEMDFNLIKNYILYGNSLAEKQMIIDKAKQLDDYVLNLKIVDPAVGSGAFLVGMLNEIVKLRLNLNELLNNKADKYSIKKLAIKNSLFGVDIENDAIEIAKLRLWLSLIVDQQVENKSSPQPLPNLVFQLRVGNSLVDKYQGVKLWNSKKMNRSGNLYDEGYDIFNANDYNDILQTLDQTKEKYFNITDETEKNHLFEKIKQDQFELVKNSLFNKGEYRIIEELIEMQKKRAKPFFIWELEFDKVFEKGGFDIVIANPPYIQLQANEGKLANELEPQKYETFTRMGDIYCIFYEQAMNLLKKKGISCFITSNKWMRAGYGEKLRGYLAKNTNPLLLVDFGGTKVFESATVDVNVLVSSKENNQYSTKTCIFDGKSTDELSVFVERKNTIVSYNGNENWCLLENRIELAIKSKIDRLGVPLSNWNIRINYGIKTGYNKAFIIDNTIKADLIRQDNKSADIIRPLLQGKDIERYWYKNSKKYIILTHNGCSQLNMPHVDVNEYPAIKNHLDKYYKELVTRKDQGYTPYNLRSCSYMDDFLKQKLVWTPVNSEYRFAILPENYYFNNSLFMITGEKIHLLCGILNSSLYRFYLNVMFSNGTYQYGSSSFFEKLKVKRNGKEIDDIVNLVKKINATNYDKYYSKIDDLVYKLYEITDEEKEYITHKIN